MIRIHHHHQEQLNSSSLNQKFRLFSNHWNRRHIFGVVILRHEIALIIGKHANEHF